MPDLLKIRQKMEQNGTLKDSGIKAKCIATMVDRSIFSMSEEYPVFSYDAADGLPTRWIIFDNNGVPTIFGVRGLLEKSSRENEWVIVHEVQKKRYALARFRTSAPITVTAVTVEDEKSLRSRV